MCVVGPLGWFLALGYRRMIYEKVLLEGGDLPRLSAHKGDCLRNGIKAASLIWVHYTPILALFWLFAYLSGTDAEVVLRGGLLSLFAFLALPPGLPVIFAYFSLYTQQVSLPPPLWLGLTGFAGVVTFLMPAMYLRIPITKSHISAMNPWPALRLAGRLSPGYLEAWVLSLVATALAFVFFPFFPWLIAYSYVVILHAFSQSLARSGHPGARRRG